MKIAVRFPVKNCPELLILCVGLHLIIIISAFIAELSLWLGIFVVVAVFISWLMTLEQYAKVTQSTGDLCWSGDSWLVATNEATNSIDYLELKSTSWITSQFCLLKFTLGSQEKAWLFTNKHMGERTYRELCYIVNQDIHMSSKQQR